MPEHGGEIRIHWWCYGMVFRASTRRVVFFIKHLCRVSTWYTMSEHGGKIRIQLLCSAWSNRVRHGGHAALWPLVGDGFTRVL